MILTYIGLKLFDVKKLLLFDVLKFDMLQLMLIVLLS